MTPAEQQHQQVLEWACKLGRFQASHDFYTPMLATPAPKPPPPAPPIHINGDGLQGVMRDALRQTLVECDGDKKATAKKLKVARGTVYDMMERFSLAVLLLALVGCSSTPNSRPVGASVLASLPQVAAPVAPVGESFSLAWDKPPDSRVVGYRLYRFSNGVTNSMDAGDTDRAIVSNVQMPESFYVTSLNAEGDESLPSNLLPLEGWDEVLQIDLLTNSAAGATDWKLVQTVFRGTNVTGSGFWRLQDKRSRVLRVGQ